MYKNVITFYVIYHKVLMAIIILYSFIFLGAGDLLWFSGTEQYLIFVPVFMRNVKKRRINKDKDSGWTGKKIPTISSISNLGSNSIYARP